MQVHACVGVPMHVCACVCGGQRTTLSVSLQAHDFVFLSHDFFLCTKINLYYFNKHMYVCVCIIGWHVYMSTVPVEARRL